MNKDRICMYLRKSRADEELEKTLGEGETLSKHRKALLKFAKEKKLNIVEIKEEVVSGDSLFFRPKMLELLKEIETRMYTGVLVMDIDRLGRGAMKDQGIILEAFKESNTKILTPFKTYDLNDEIDEEMTEFKTFFSRRELKTINRRMQGGRVRSVEDGNYIATNPPYGYDIHWIKKSRTLKINAEESEIVKLIFKLYTEGNGSGAICEYLNGLGYKTKFGNNFTRSSVLCLIKNPIYVGKVTWKKKEIKKSKTPGKVKDTRTRDKSEWIVVKGKHEPIIDIDTWNKAQNILNNRYHIPYQIVNGAANPLAGVIICGVCGSKMVMRKFKGNTAPRILCNKKCGNVSHSFFEIEKDILDGLEQYLKNYKKMQFENKNKNDDDIKIYEKQLNILQKELLTLNEQKLKLFDLLERGIYDENTFLERSNNLDVRIKKINGNIQKTESNINKNKLSASKNDIMEFENIIAGYKKVNDVKKKNELMKTIVNKIEFKKTKRGEEFELKLFPRLLP